MGILPPRLGPPSLGAMTAVQVLAEQASRMAEQRRSNESVVTNLVAFVRRRWQVAKDAKREHERTMLRCLRMRKCEYEPDKLTAIRQAGGSAVYLGIAAQKCRDAESWIRDIDMPADETPWIVDPAPIPELPPDAMAQIESEATARMQQIAASGGMLDASPREYAERVAERARAELREEAQERADRMGDLIQTQLQAGGWDRAFRAFVSDLVTFPAAILRGPIVRRRKRLAWTQQADGANWTASAVDELRPEIDRVSPFDIYPSADATDSGRSYMIEVMELSRSDLYAMIGVPTFSESELRAALDEYDRGGTRRDWQGDVQDERERIEGRGDVAQTKESDTIRCLSYWGNVPGKWLIEWGMRDGQITDKEAEYQVNVWLAGQHAVRAMINDDPLGRDPYHITSFERIPGAFWGRGVCELCAGTNESANAAARSLNNNIAFASGPIVEFDLSRFGNGSPPQIGPWARIEAENPLNAPTPAVRFFQADMRATELMSVIDFWLDKADQVSGVPRYLHGDQQATGAATTMGGLSMLMSASAKGLRDVLGNIDADVLATMVGRMIEFNMRFSDDPTVKGDLHARAIGSSSMMQREQQAQRRTEFMQATNNPVDNQILGLEGRAKLLREAAKPLEFREDIVPDEEELSARIANERAQAQAQASAQQGMPERAQ